MNVNRFNKVCTNFQQLCFVARTKQPLTLSGVDEKPQNKAEIISDYRGFMFYYMLAAPGVFVGCKVAIYF